MSNNIHLQFGWHSHVPYVLNSHNYYREHRKETCAKWVFDSVAGFTEYFKIFDSVDAFSSFLSISGQAVEQFVSLAEMDSHLRNYLMALNFGDNYLKEIKRSAISLLENVKRYTINGRLELIGTGYNHPIMPFLHEDQFLAEIERSRNMFREYFGVNEVLGFFPPESCIRSRDIDLYVRSGLKYLVLEDPAYMEVRHSYTRAGNNNAYLLTDAASNSSLYCFNRNRAVSLLSWLSDQDEMTIGAEANGGARADIRYQKLDHSVDRTRVEFASIFSDARHQTQSRTDPAQFARLVRGLIAREINDNPGAEPTGIMLFTDHEYLGAGATIFPRMQQAVALLANGADADFKVQFSTLRDYHCIVEQTSKPVGIEVKHGSWCSGLMLADGFVATKDDGSKLYSHGTLAAPFANWRSFSFHYDLAKSRWDGLRARAAASGPDPDVSRLLDQVGGWLNVACTSCFYGWFPPVYRMIPAFELYKRIHEMLSVVGKRLGQTVEQSGPACDDNALAALQGRIVQFKLGAGEESTCIQRIELSILCARNIFYLAQHAHYSQAYQLLIDAAKELDDLFEVANYDGSLFPEPNDPWDLWRRELEGEEYV